MGPQPGGPYIALFSSSTETMKEEIEGWRDVMQECRVSAREIKGYSVILRQELEWVLGGWDVTPGSGPRGGGLDLRWDRNPS